MQKETLAYDVPGTRLTFYILAPAPGRSQEGVAALLSVSQENIQKRTDENQPRGYGIGYRLSVIGYR